MKSYKRYLQVSFVVLALCVPATHSFCQSKKTENLEERVTALEQRVNMLEAKMYTMIGGRSGELMRAKSMMMRDLTNISIQAHQYLLRPAAQNGGAGSYAGFSLAPKMAQTDVATYTVTPGDTDVVIEGQPVFLNGKIKVRVGYSGRIDLSTFTGDLFETRNPTMPMRGEPEGTWQVIDGEILGIVANAYQYRNRPQALGGGGGSYVGYAIPKGMASTGMGLYTVIPTDGSVAIEARSKLSNSLAVVTADSAGKVKLRSTVFAFAEPKRLPVGPKTAVDSVRENVTIDFTAIAARAFQYKVRPVSNGGGGGKYTGYLSAQTSSFAGTVRYDLQVDPDIIVLRAISAHGQGTISAKVDGNGKLSGWYYTGEFAK